MRILITAADTDLGRLASAELSAQHQVRPALGDLRDPDAAALQVAGIDAVVHLEPYALGDPTVALPDAEVLDRAARGTYVLLGAAVAAGVQRIVLGSRLDLVAAHGPAVAVDETWCPQPPATAAALAPLLAELTLREFVRAEPVLGVCLRFGRLGSTPDGTTPADAAHGLRRSLEMEPAPSHYRWWLFHVGSTDRYPLGAAERPPFSFSRVSG